MDILRQNLESMSYQGYGSNASLLELMRLLKMKTGGMKKAEAVEILHRFYSDQDCAAGLIGQLDEYEKAILTCIVQSNYRPLREDIDEIAKKFNHKTNTGYYYSSDYRAQYFDKDSKLYAFFVNGSIPPAFKEYLKKAIPPYVRIFSPADVKDMDDYAAIIGRFDRYKDFDMLVSFINNNKAAATKAGGYMNKNALIKFHAIAGYDDICNNESGDFQDIRNAGETMVSVGMVQLLRCAQVIDIVQDRFVLSKKASHFAGLSMPEKAKFLFEAYMRHNNRIIDECARISAAKLKFSRSVYDLSGPRREIVSFLEECPIGEWIDFKRFSNEIYKANNRLFDVAGDVLIRDDYSNQYYNIPAWDDFEYCAISVVLVEYLATLGAVDILAEEATHSDYDYDSYSGYEASYFRVTELGAYLFGLTDSYNEKQPEAASADEKGFVVQPNFDVVIQAGKDRMRHELFFDRFAEKSADSKEVSIYKLDFKGMATALSIGLTIPEIRAYCDGFSNAPLPDNVKAEFAKWEAQSGRIRIRTVSIIESDDVFLLEEIKNYKGMDSMLEGGVASVLALKPGSEKKAKTLIEKNKRFCALGENCSV